jgi:1-deoxy-D-xylulose-5-phosphate reductoisomerase
MASPLAWLRPIDSEHSAIWQCLVGERLEDVARLILTASGGPFRRLPAEQLAQVTPADALAHPTWRMGAKITIDSATLMNKGLEVIEAHWLYDCDYGRIDVVVHPQSVIHSAVEFTDGSVKAQLGLPDMRIPIQYALSHPRRAPSPAPRLSLAELPDLEFEAPDSVRFPALPLARAAGEAGPRATAALIAADEVAVGRFLDGTLDFPGITRLVAGAVERYGQTGATPELESLVELDAEVRAWAASASGAAT